MGPAKRGQRRCAAGGFRGAGSDEIREYRKVVRLGLREWDLFLDLVLAYLERETIRTRSTRCKPLSRLARSVRRTFQPSGGLRESCSIKQRREREIVIALRMAPADPDMRKTKAIICAELG